jgi:hypothetical protein
MLSEPRVAADPERLAGRGEGMTAADKVGEQVTLAQLVSILFHLIVIR